jgi:hypothetical protein
MAAIFFEDKLHFFVELIGDLLRPIAQLFYSISEGLLGLFANICKQIRPRMSLDGLDSGLYLLDFGNGVFLAGSF